MANIGPYLTKIGKIVQKWSKKAKKWPKSELFPKNDQIFLGQKFEKSVSESDDYGCILTLETGSKKTIFCFSIFILYRSESKFWADKEEKW